MAKRIGKYGVAPKSKRTLKGVVYMSKLEMMYRKHLDLLTKATGNNKVLSIEEQVPYEIVINGHKICKYILDFKVTYPDRIEYVDTKGIVTSIYRLKSKLMYACHGIKIKEVKAGMF